MLSPFVLGMALLVAAAGAAHAQAAPPEAAAPAPEPPKAPVQTTTVHGTLPDLSGHWVLLFDLQLGPQHRTVPSFLDIETKDGKLEAVERFVNLPADLNAQVEEGNARNTLWEPTSEQLATVWAQWRELPDADRGVTAVSTELWAMDAYDDTIRKEADLSGATWVLRQTYSFTPGGQRPLKAVGVYGAMARDGSGWRGTAVLVQVAAAPFPIPITLKGNFRLLRLGEPPPARGLLARLLDALKGCGR